MVQGVILHNVTQLMDPVGVCWTILWSVRLQHLFRSPVFHEVPGIPASVAPLGQPHQSLLHPTSSDELWERGDHVQTLRNNFMNPVALNYDRCREHGLHGHPRCSRLQPLQTPQSTRDFQRSIRSSTDHYIMVDASVRVGYTMLPGRQKKRL